MEEENVLANVEARYVIFSAARNPPNSVPSSSKELFSSLHALRENPDVGQYILDVRGSGLMVAVEFASSTARHDPSVVPSAPKNLASRVSKRCLEKGMMLLTTSIYEVVRFIPPLNISQEDMSKGCQIFVEAVEEVVREG